VKEEAVEDLAGRVAAITGAGGGIGAALARACAEAGMDVALADVEAARVEAVAEEIRGLGRRALAMGVDVRRSEAVDAFAARTFAELGGCDLVCNNAGVLVLGLTHQRSLEDWDWVLSVNLWGVIHGVRAFVPRLIEQGRGGHVVNTASIAGLVPAPANGTYTASKYAVVGLSECLRIDLASVGIGVSVLCPGPVKTGILKSERNRPAELGSSKLSREDALAVMQGGDTANQTFIEPERAARAVLEAVRRDEPYVITHPGSKGLVEERFRALLAAYDTARARDPELP
jgi:NAD(P)-dependent dehydrogenase (short-subunit alcohol dehydrogenase family)